MCHNIIFVVVYSLIACRSFVRPIATSDPALPHSRHLLGANSAFIFSHCLCLCLRCGRSWSLFFFRFAWGSAVANDLSFVLIAADVAVTAVPSADSQTHTQYLYLCSWFFGFCFLIPFLYKFLLRFNNITNVNKHAALPHFENYQKTVPISTAKLTYRWHYR